MTTKHQILQNPTSKISGKKYTCACGKMYKHSSTLYAHRKKCDIYNNTAINYNVIDIGNEI